MNSEELNECFEFVKDLISQCGEVLKEGFKDCGEVTSKRDPRDVVTVYDQKIEKMLMNAIGLKYPDHKFIAEEQSAENNQTPPLTSSPTWIIDPIDGTFNFVKKIPLVCISVALAINEELVMAYLYNPLTDEFFTARKGHGAFLNGKQIKVSEHQELKNSTIVFEVQFANFSFARPTKYARMNAFFDNSIAIKSFRSAALELGYVAKGSFESMTSEHLKPWDIAAGALVVIEAGGVVIDIKTGENFKIMQPNIIAASSMKIALEIKKLLDDVNAKMEAEGTTMKALYAKYKADGGSLKI